VSGRTTHEDVLACCHGFSIIASDRLLGVVETPVFSGAALEPDYLIVRTADSIPGSFLKVPLALVGEVDGELGRISLSAPVEDIIEGRPDPRAGPEPRSADPTR